MLTPHVGWCPPPGRPIITNTAALSVSQSWFGHPGTLSDQDKDTAGQRWQVWAKPQGVNRTAVLIVNTGFVL